MRNKKTASLTEKQRSFLDGLIRENKHYISNTVLNTLGKPFSFLYEDCISELYLLACLKIDVAETHPNPAAWIIVCARLTAHTVIQKRKREMAEVTLDEDIPDNGDVFDEVLYNIWIENGVALKIIDQLTPREREVYNLIYIKGKKPEEAAKFLGISHSTVRNIRKQLKEKIKNKVYKSI